MALLRQGYGGRANALDKAVRAQGGAVVKPQQVKAMVIAAHRAFKVQEKVGLVDDGEDFDTWRRAALHDIVGAAAPSSFRAVTQRDFAAVMEYFARLAGDRTSDFGHRTSETTRDDETRRALWALTLEEGESAEAFGGREGARCYADALFEKIHKTDRYAATAKQIWAVIFTLRNRAKKRAEARRFENGAKTALGARGAAGVHLGAPGPSKRFPAFSRAL